MRGMRSSLVLAAVLFAGCGAAFVPQASSGFVKLATVNHPHYIYRPVGASSEKLPAIVYLHGGGERGDDGLDATQVGLGPIVNESNGKFPFLVAFPQAPKNRFWTFPDMQERVLAVVDELIRDYNADPTRIYLTGNSMGGYGTWLIGARNPGRFAALVPLCGGVVPPPGVRLPQGAEKSEILSAPDPYAKVAEMIGATPVWAFHGAADWMMPVAVSRKMVDALKAKGGNVRYTEYPGVGHAVEKVAYRNAELFRWLAEQHVPSQTRGDDAQGPSAKTLSP